MFRVKKNGDFLLIFLTCVLFVLSWTGSGVAGVLPLDLEIRLAYLRCHDRLADRQVDRDSETVAERNDRWLATDKEATTKVYFPTVYSRSDAMLLKPDRYL